jgi:hypothetical protein
VRFGVNGEWGDPRVLQVQFQGISDHNIDQFRNGSNRLSWHQRASPPARSTTPMPKPSPLNRRRSARRRVRGGRRRIEPRFADMASQHLLDHAGGVVGCRGRRRQHISPIFGSVEPTYLGRCDGAVKQTSSAPVSWVSVVRAVAVSTSASHYRKASPSFDRVWPW